MMLPTGSLVVPFMKPLISERCPGEFRVRSKIACPEELGCFLILDNLSSTTDHISLFDMATRELRVTFAGQRQQPH